MKVSKLLVSAIVICGLNGLAHAQPEPTAPPADGAMAPEKPAHPAHGGHGKHKKPAKHE